MDLYSSGQQCETLVFYFEVSMNKLLNKQSRYRRGRHGVHVTSLQCPEYHNENTTQSWTFSNMWSKAGHVHCKRPPCVLIVLEILCSSTTLTLMLTLCAWCIFHVHYNDDIMGGIASQITSLTIIYSTVYSVAVQRKHKSSATLAFVGEIHRWPVNSPHKWPVTPKMFYFDDVIMAWLCLNCVSFEFPLGTCVFTLR